MGAAKVNQYGAQVISLTVPAAADSAGATGLSESVNTADRQIAALEISATWVTAAITFAAASSDGGTYKPVYGPDGSEVSITVTAGAISPLTGNELAALTFIKVRSGSVGAPVAQATARAINLILK